MTIQPRSRRILLAAASACLILASASPSAAQVARYQPQTGTISPYLNLARFNGGGLPNYYALVRPQLQQRQINQQAQTVLLNQDRRLSRLQGEVQQGSITPSATGTGSWFMVPGKEAKFLNTTSFYPEPVFRGQRR